MDDFPETLKELSYWAINENELSSNWMSHYTQEELDGLLPLIREEVEAELQREAEQKEKTRIAREEANKKRVEEAKKREAEIEANRSKITAIDLYATYESNKAKFEDDLVGKHNEKFQITGVVEEIDENVELCGKFYDYVGCGFVERVSAKGLSLEKRKTLSAGQTIVLLCDEISLDWVFEMPDVGGCSLK